MGDYADMCFEEGLAGYEYDMNDPDFVDYDDFLSGRRRPRYRKTKWIDYKIYKIIKETEKGLLILFAREDNGEPWGYAFWWPKSKVFLFDDDTVSVPEWLLDRKFEEGGIEMKEQNNETR